MVTDYGRNTRLFQAKTGFMLILRWKRAFSHAHPALDNSQEFRRAVFLIELPGGIPPVLSGKSQDGHGRR
jgi:hypothetical protein